MKTEQWEQWVLLEASGELTFWRRWRLQRELARSAELRAFQDAMRGLTSPAVAAHTLSGIPATPRDVMASILAAADASAGHTHTPAWTVRWATACAAAVLIAAGTWMTWQKPPLSPAPAAAHASLSWDDAWDEQLASLRSELTQNGGEWTEMATANDELDALAGQLLEAEGVEI